MLIRLGQWWFGGDHSPWRWYKERVAYGRMEGDRNVCWSDAVSWFLGYNERPGEGSSARCRADARKDGSCYCCRFACRERLAEIGSTTDGITPLEWVAPTEPGEGRA